MVREGASRVRSNEKKSVYGDDFLFATHIVNHSETFLLLHCFDFDGILKVCSDNGQLRGSLRNAHQEWTDELVEIIIFLLYYYAFGAADCGKVVTSERRIH